MPDEPKPIVPVNLYIMYEHGAMLNAGVNSLESALEFKKQIQIAIANEEDSTEIEIWPEETLTLYNLASIITISITDIAAANKRSIGDVPYRHWVQKQNSDAEEAAEAALTDRKTGFGA